MFENIKEDLKTYHYNWTRQGFWVMVVYRYGNWRYTIGNRWLRKPFSLLYHIMYKWIQIVTGVELPCEAVLGKNFVIEHFGGIIVSGYAVFGDDCIIRQGVTIGLRHIDHVVAPKIGNRVNIGAGAKILGPITIGNNVDIGANAVVIKDVPDNSIAIGVPAKILPKKSQLESVDGY